MNWIKVRSCCLIIWLFSCLCCINHNVLCANSKRTNKFVTYLFNKYGSRGIITFEGLEHMMHNLGIGGIEFNTTHTLAEHRADNFKLPELSFHDNDNMQIQPDFVEKKDDKGAVEDEKNSNNADIDVDWSDTNWPEILFKDLHNPDHSHAAKHPEHESCLSPISIIHSVMDRPITKDDRTLQNLNYEVTATAADPPRDNENVSDKRRYQRSIEDIGNINEEENDKFEYIISAAALKITPRIFMQLCPALLMQIDQGVCREVSRELIKGHDDHNHASNSNDYAWLYASICILIISLCGLTGVAIVPLAKSIAYDEILRFFVALAVGTLCGDALMHLLPHALTPHLDHGDDNLSATSDGHLNDEPVWLCSCAFMSALLMYTLETILPMLGSNTFHSHSHGHSHSGGHTHSNHEKPSIPNKMDELELDLHVNSKSQDKELGVMLEKQKVKKSFKLTPVAFMVILGDGLHNITDGLAIGAAFASDPVTGMATSLAVLCHELPHELGDFALLLQTGVSIQRALFFNLLSSVLSFIGMICGLVVARSHTSTVRWIYAGTAGTFLYIALADLIPEMGRENKKKTFKSVFSQIFGVLLGGVIMLAIALNEDRLRILFE